MNCGSLSINHLERLEYGVTIIRTASFHWGRFITVRLHVMQSTVLRRTFCPSVRLSVCQTRVL